MPKIIIYTTGERYFMEGMTLSLHGGEIKKEHDLEKATEEELKKLKENPHNDKLISEIARRR